MRRKRTTRDKAKVGDVLRGAFGRHHEEEDEIVGTGHLLVELFDEDGNLKDYREVDNLVVTVGKNMITEQLLAAPSSPGKPTHMAVGTGAVAPAAGDTALGAESARVALTSKTRAANVLTLVGDYAAGVATATLTEAGVFDAATTGNMGSRATFTGIPKGASDTLKVTWTWTIG
jgi:hypothetical protein